MVIAHFLVARLRRDLSLANFVALAAMWHFVWVVLTILVGLVASQAIFGGSASKDAAYNLLQGVMGGVVYLLFGLIVNVVLAAAIWRGVGQADIRMRVGLAGTIGLVVWSPLASTFVPLSDAGVPIDARVAAALVGAVAGFGYGAVLGAVVGRLSNESAND